jgi:hypothetical protein
MGVDVDEVRDAIPLNGGTEPAAGFNSYAFLGAVHELIDSSRVATSADLVLAATCHALRSGDKTPTELVAIVDQIWPGARTSTEVVLHALELGQELHLVEQRQAIGDSTLWALTVNGVDDVERQVSWAHDLRERTRIDLVRRAERDLDILLDSATSELWLDRLVRALVEGVRRSQDVYLGRVDEIVGHRLSPRGIDQGTVVALLDDARSNPATVDFLKSCAIAAFDPLDPFGTDLISHITVGCVLHSYVAGRDGSAALQRLGSPIGQRALLDTPVLVDLIGPRRVSDPTQVTIKAAVAAGWDVIVCEHSVQELTQVVSREVPLIRRAFAEAHAAGVRDEWYASLVADQLPSYCIEALRDGTYSSVDELIGAAEGVVEVLQRLGVQVREHGNDNDLAYVERCRRALETTLATARRRSEAVVQRDADSMALLWRTRRRPQRGAWPGGWIITSDRQITSAYRVAQTSDQVQLTLSLPQWTTLLSVTVPPAEIVDLATAAATQLLDEAIWLLPSRYPSDVALDLARQLSPERGGSEMDLRIAQLSMEDLLDEADERRSATSIAADVLAERMKRAEILKNLAIDSERRQRQAAESQAAASARRSQDESARADRETRRAVEALAKNAELEGDMHWKDLRFRRLAISCVVAASLGVLAAACWALRLPMLLSIWLTLIFGASVVTAVRWCQARTRSYIPLVLVAVIEVASIAVTLFAIGGLPCQVNSSECPAPSSPPSVVP